MMTNIKGKSAAIAAFACLLAFAAASIGRAQLITLTVGNYIINADGFSSSTLSTDPNDFAPGGLPQDGVGPNEDTWGIFQITSITQFGNPEFNENGGTELWGIFYNSVDIDATDFGSFIHFESTGLKLDIYEVSILDTADAAWTTVYNQGTGGRTSLADYKGISVGGGAGINGNVFGTQVFSAELIGIMESFFTKSSGTTSANGSLSVTYNDLFDPGAGNTLGDMVFSFGGFTDIKAEVPADWTVSFGGDITGSVVPIPEPSVYGAVAAAFLGGIILRRRRKNVGTRAA